MTASRRQPISPIGPIQSDQSSQIGPIEPKRPFFLSGFPMAGFGKAYSPIGIDLQAASCKLLQMHSSGGETGIAALASVEFSGNILNLEEGQPDGLVHALKTALKENGFHGSTAVMTVPQQKIDVRTLTLPGPEVDLEKVLRWEAEAYLHYDINSACMDYTKVGEITAGSEKRMEVLVAAINRDYLQAVLHWLSAAGIEVAVVDVVPMALARLGTCPRLQYETESLGMLDIGRSTTTAAVLNKGELRLTRNINRGGDELTARICDSLEIANDEAELLKREYGTGLPGRHNLYSEQELLTRTEIAGTIHEILRHDLEEMAAEVQKLYRYFSTQCKGATAQKGYLCGGGGRMSGLDEFLSQHTGLAFEKLPPLNELFAWKTDTAIEAGPEFAVSAGLALRKL